MKHIISLIGPTNTGKTTLSLLAKTLFNYQCINVGNILRKMSLEDNRIGKEIYKNLAKGYTVNNKIIQDILFKYLKSFEEESNIIIDGVPRNKEQFETLKNCLSSIINVNFKVIYLETSKKTIIERAVNRIYCTSCDTVFNVEFYKNKICNLCNTSSLKKRNDDTESLAILKFDKFFNDASDIINFLRQNNNFFIINTEKDINIVKKEFIEIITKK